MLSLHDSRRSTGGGIAFSEERGVTKGRCYSSEMYSSVASVALWRAASRAAYLEQHAARHVSERAAEGHSTGSIGS